MEPNRLIYIPEEHHFVRRTTWIRAAVLGANDGIISVSSLVIGIASAAANIEYVLLTGIAGLVAGAMSMAAGEYVSVSSQSDLEAADLAREKKELEEDYEDEVKELVEIYVERGVEPTLAHQVVRQMMAKDALATHAREELGISEITVARPLNAAIASAISFSIGAAFPILATLFIPRETFVLGTSILSILLLGILGGVGAKLGGAPILKPIIRVVFWGAIAMLLTGLIGNIFDIKI